jgi:hypothetical protein
MAIIVKRRANIEDAIHAISPTTEFSCSPADSTAGITWLSGSPISAEDLEAKKVELQGVYDAEFVQKEAKKATGKQKLKDLGLDDEEIKELTGA